MVGQRRQFNGHQFERTLGDNGAEEPGMLQFLGSQGVGHDLTTE